MGKVSLLSLGCPKNLVDSENLLKKIREKGVGYASLPEDADVILVNTCGFIEAAKRESVDEILKLARVKRKGRKLVVFGCLAQRYRDELINEIPEIDALWGVGRDDEIAEYCYLNAGADDTAVHEGQPPDRPYEYLKIAEGCDRGCSYCVIPKIRGDFRSRDPKEVLRDAEAFIRRGAKEIILIAQDITSYGKEINGYSLNRLVREIAALKGDFWIRLLYLYPTSITDELLHTIAEEEKVCAYIDMPLQHSENSVLKRMGRGGGRELYRRIIRKIRDTIPGVTLRTTLIVGFPGETEEEFQEMLDFVKEQSFDRLGVFTYSREEGTPAYSLKNTVPKKVKELRYGKIMETQSRISLEKNKALVGLVATALVDEVADGVATARLCSQAPEIDGVVFIRESSVRPNSFVRVRITKAYDYDLEGVIA